MNITWTESFLKMPPRYENVIVMGGLGGMAKCLGRDVYEAKKEIRFCLKWTPFTEEKWEFLNK